MTTVRTCRVFASAALVAAGIAAWFGLGAMIDAQRPVSDAYRASAAIDRLGNLVNQVDRARRAYHDAPDPAGQRLLRDASGALTGSLAEVRALTTGDPVQQRIVDQVIAAVGEARLDRAASLAGTMQDHEAVVLDGLLQETSAGTWLARWLIVAVLGGAVLLVAAGGARRRPAPDVAIEAAAAGRADLERHLAEEREIRATLVGTA